MKREAFQAKGTASAIAWRQGKPELVAGVTIEIHDRVSDHKNPTMNRRKGEDQVLIFFFKHQTKTTNWNAEKKYYFCEQRNQDVNELEEFCVVFSCLSTAFISVLLNVLLFT